MVFEVAFKDLMSSSLVWSYLMVSNVVSFTLIQQHWLNQWQNQLVWGVTITFFAIPFGEVWQICILYTVSSLLWSYSWSKAGGESICFLFHFHIISKRTLLFSRHSPCPSGCCWVTGLVIGLSKHRPSEMKLNAASQQLTLLLQTSTWPLSQCNSHRGTL